MKPEAQRIAIAEACGWSRCGSVDLWSKWDGAQNEYAGISGGQDMHKLPDYLNDLNAMHEAEKTLTFHQSDVYARTLACDRGSDELTSHFRAAHATAAQRAGAFLKTLNLWKY